MMSYDEYLDQFLDELRNRGVVKGDPHSINTLKRVAALYRNAGYTPQEAAQLEAEEGE